MPELTTPMFVTLPADGLTRAIVHVVDGKFEVALERLDDDCWYEYGVASMDAADHLIVTVR